MRLLLLALLLGTPLLSLAQASVPPLPPDPHTAYKRDIRFVPYRKGDKWGLMTQDKQWVLKPKHKLDSVSLFRVEMAVVKAKGKLGLMDTTGQILIKPLYTSIYYSDDLQAYVLEREGTKQYFLYDKKLYTSLPDAYNPDSGLLEIYEETGYAPDLTTLERYKSQEGKWGVHHKDQHGNILFSQRSIPAEYDELKPFAIFFLVRQGGQWGVVAEGNKIVVPLAFEAIKNPDFGSSYPVKQGGKWGIYDSYKAKKVVVPCVYDDIITAPFAEGFGFRLVQGDKMGYYSLDTKQVIAPAYQFIRGFHNPGISPAISASGRFGYVGLDGYKYFED